MQETLPAHLDELPRIFKGRRQRSNTFRYSVDYPWRPSDLNIVHLQSAGEPSPGGLPHILPRSGVGSQIRLALAIAGLACTELQRGGATPSRGRSPWTERLRQLDSDASHVRVSAALGAVAIPGSLVVIAKVYRVLKQKRWFVHQRVATPRPRVRGWVSRASRSNERWAMDVTHIPCGQDGWAHLAAVIDCHDREVIGYEFALAESSEGGGASGGSGLSRSGSGRCGRWARRSCGVTTA